MQHYEELSVQAQFEKVFLRDHPHITDMRFDSSRNCYLNPAVQPAWWGWQQQDSRLEEMLESKRDYICDCGYLDMDGNDERDYEQVDFDEAVKNEVLQKFAHLIDRANRFGNEEIFEELKQMSFKIGKPLLSPAFPQSI